MIKLIETIGTASVHVEYPQAQLARQKPIDVVAACVVVSCPAPIVLEHDDWAMMPNRVTRAFEDMQLGALDVDLDQSRHILRL
jgi:hypothetical protein